LVLAAFVVLLACTDRDDDLGRANIRIRNLSNLTYDEVVVGAQEVLYEGVAPGDFSDYLPFDTAHEYDYVSIRAGEETYVLQPVDFVGATALPIGLYTYELNVSPEGEVTLNFKAD